MTIAALINLLIYILIIGVIVWLILYVISVIPLPAPFNQVARVIVIVIACLVVILLLLRLAGMPINTVFLPDHMKNYASALLTTTETGSICIPTRCLVRESVCSA